MLLVFCPAALPTLKTQQRRAAFCRTPAAAKKNAGFHQRFAITFPIIHAVGLLPYRITHTQDATVA